MTAVTSTPFVGRDSELSWLRRLWEEVSAPGGSGPRMAVLVAETGLGKSRIVQEFYRRLCADPDWNDGYWPDAFDGAHAAHVNPDLSAHQPTASPRFLWLATRWLDVDARNAEARRLAVPDLRARLAAHVRVAIHHAPIWQRARAATARALKQQGLAGGVEQVVQEGVGKAFEAATGGLPFGGLLVSLARTAPDVFIGPSTPGEHATAATADAADALLDELGEVFGGFGGGGLVLPTVLWLDDAQWIDADTTAVLHRIWDRASERAWPLLVVITHWEREWRLLAAAEPDARPESLRRYDEAPGVSVRYLATPADADLEVLLGLRLPGLTARQRQAILSRAGGNFLTLIENIGELISQPANFAGRDIRGPLARAGERRVAEWESDRERRVRQRFAALDDRLRDLLGWSSHGGQRFLHAVLTQFLATREVRPGLEPRRALATCVDPLAILADPSPAFFEFRDVALHRAAREYFDLYLAEHDEPALDAALRQTLTTWVNACFDAHGAFVAASPSPEESEVAGAPVPRDAPLLHALDEAARREVLVRAVRELSLESTDWADPEWRAALRSRVWLMRFLTHDGAWQEVARLASPLAALDVATCATGVVAPALVVDAARAARLAGAMAASARLFEIAHALAQAPDVTEPDAHAEALAAHGASLVTDDPATSVGLLHQALAVAQAAEGASLEFRVRVNLALSTACELMDDADGAEQAAREALDLQRIRLEPGDPRLSRPLGRLGWVLLRMRRLDEAEPLLEEALAIQRKWADMADVMPARWQVDVVPALLELGGLRERQGRFTDAEDLLREALDTTRRRVDDPSQIYPVLRLAWFLAARGRSDEALTLITEGVELARRVLGVDHPQTRAMADARDELLHSRP